MTDKRIIALHAQQIWASGERRSSSYILMSEDEAEKLENALRLARTGKPNKERPVPTHTPDENFWGVSVKSTRFVVKGYYPKDRGAS